MGRRLLLLTEDVEELKDKLAGLEVGDHFTFGHYCGTLEWRVLEKDSDSLLVISEYGVDAIPFDEDGSTDVWNSCSLKEWLHSEFFNYAFSYKNRYLIKNTPYGKVFCLSLEEAEKYFSSDSDRRCKPTPYAIRQGVFTRQGYCNWWLRTPGYSELEEPDDDPSDMDNYSDECCVADVSYDGDVDSEGFFADEDSVAIRPAMRLKI